MKSLLVLSSLMLLSLIAGCARQSGGGISQMLADTVESAAQIVIDNEESDSGTSQSQPPLDMAPQEEVGGEIVYSVASFDPEHCWETYEDDRGWVQCADGWLVMRNLTDSPRATMSWANLSLENFVLEVETKWVGGTDDNWHLVRIRSGSESEYIVGISADGYYTIGHEDAESISAIIDPEPSDHIHTGMDDVNVMRIVSADGSLALFVNGQFLTEADNLSPSRGDIALEVQSMAGEYSDIAYRNLTIMAP
jgi:hypothetical protein